MDCRVENRIAEQHQNNESAGKKRRAGARKGNVQLKTPDDFLGSRRRPMRFFSPIGAAAKSTAGSLKISARD